jgi:hypothetical protein
LKTHLIIPDSHAHPDFNNDRATLLSKLIVDINPDVVINMGDAADMPSLADFDKGKRSFVGRSYQKDIDSHLDFQDKLWSPIRKRKKKLPYRVVLEGNHEHRIERALDASPILDGTISFQDFDLSGYYDNVVRYEGNTPGIIDVDGISYSHYFVGGIMGRPSGSIHGAYTNVSKRHSSCTQSHSHLLDYYICNTGYNALHGLVAGCFIDYPSSWAGQSQNLWWSGVVVKHNVENGDYSPQFISLKMLEKEYGGKD